MYITRRETVLRRFTIAPAPIEQDRVGRPIVGPCLLWQGRKLPSGYGQTGEGKGTRYVHRLMYEWFVGPIEHNLDHLCRVRHCAAPAHLEDVPQSQNVRRGDRHLARYTYRGVTHCKHGHPFDESNTYIGPTGKRACRTCNRESMRLYRKGLSRKAMN
jgi:hypothetical protein